MLSNSDNYEVAMGLLLSHGIPEEDVALWEAQFDTVPPEMLLLFIETIGENKEALVLATENLKKKMAAGTDKAQIRKIVEEEERELLEKLLKED